MKHYVVADPHGFYTELIEALKNAGFFDDKEPHKLIVCGDALDRGGEAVKMQNFLLELYEKGELIFVRGNHEDLLEDMMDDVIEDPWMFLNGYSHHVRNGTFDTAMQLSKMNVKEAIMRLHDLVFATKESPFYKTLMPSSVDYYETEHYVFVHGWIPFITTGTSISRSYHYNPSWREASAEEWRQARWPNGMDMAEKFGIIEPGKTVVCGHWHASYGHFAFEHKGAQHGPYADYSPYFGTGIIALDACTARTRMVNCIVIED